MSVTPVGEPASFWHRFAHALDAYFASRTQREVSEITLRRSKHEIARCRRLMHKHVAVPTRAGIGKDRALTR
jgi:hypothetical protein